MPMWLEYFILIPQLKTLWEKNLFFKKMNRGVKGEMERGKMEIRRGRKEEVRKDTFTCWFWI